jgi:hypothetical protein
MTMTMMTTVAARRHHYRTPMHGRFMLLKHMLEYVRMTHTLADYFTMFCSNFFVVFLLGLQSKNVNQGMYLAAITTSFGISIANFVFVKYAAVGSYDVFAVCAAGGMAGIAFSIWFYKHFFERKRHGKYNPA